MDDAAASPDNQGRLPGRSVTLNQLVGYNMAFFRQAAGFTQEELGQRLGGWTKVAVSAAERSWSGKRIRKFDADEIVAIAATLGVPALALLLPPPDAGTVVDYIFTTGSVPMPPVETTDLLARLFSTSGNTRSPAMKAFRERVMALGASGLLFGGADEFLRFTAEEVLNRANTEAAYTLGKAQEMAQDLPGDAWTRAAALEWLAEERDLQAVGSLVQQREELERRVDDLRAFEREYRSRLLAYLQTQVRELQAGTAEEDSPDEGVS